jgi:hypothetical protein
MPTYNNIQNDGIQDIIGVVPTSLIRYGMLLITFLIVLFCLAGWFIKVPEKLTAKIILTTINPPVNIVAKKDGRIIAINKKDNDTILPNENITIIESDAKFEDIEWINNNLTSFKNFKNNNTSVNEIVNSKILISGEISNYYNSFVQVFRKYFVIVNDITKQEQIADLKSQLFFRNNLDGKLKEQTALEAKQVELENIQYERTNILYTKKINSLKEVQDQEKTLLGQQSQQKTTEINSINNSLTTQQIKGQIKELNNSYSIQKKEAENNVLQSLAILENELYKWKKTYVLQSTTSGILSFGTVWNVNQQIKTGQVIATVSSDQQQTIGKITLPVYNTGKIKVGNEVRIKLDDYPYEKNGMLKTTISSISHVPFDGNYIVTVNFSDNLETTYHKQIPNKPEMNGTAEIILSNERLINILLSKVLRF